MIYRKRIFFISEPSNDFLTLIIVKSIFLNLVKSASSAADIADLKLRVVIRDRSGAIFEGEADAVSSNNDKGLFDILPLHTNFICIIHKGLTLHLKDKVVKELSFGTGVLRVAENKVEIYLGILR